jgi:hypothetical protein
MDDLYQVAFKQVGYSRAVRNPFLTPNMRRERVPDAALNLINDCKMVYYILTNKAFRESQFPKDLLELLRWPPLDQTAPGILTITPSLDYYRAFVQKDVEPDGQLIFLFWFPFS